MELMVFLFVGERRSERAKKLGIRWETGGLAAAPLFDALRQCGIEPVSQVHFTNLFERGGWGTVRRARLVNVPIVAMGKKVQIALYQRGITHYRLTHPAARGKIRKRHRYVAHVRNVLSSVGDLR